MSPSSLEAMMLIELIKNSIRIPLTRLLISVPSVTRKAKSVLGLLGRTLLINTDTEL